MRTVVVDSEHNIWVDTRPDPPLPGPDGAIVEVTDSAICGSDLHFLKVTTPSASPCRSATRLSVWWSKPARR